MKLFGKDKPTEEELKRREERNKRFFEYGQRVSQRIRYHERVDKANKWATENKKKLVLYSFFGVLMMYVPLVLHTTYKKGNRKAAYASEMPITNNSVEGNMRIIEAQRGLHDNVKELAREGNEYVAVFDSLAKKKDKTHEDSVKLVEAYEKIHKINSILESK